MNVINGRDGGRQWSDQELVDREAVRYCSTVAWEVSVFIGSEERQRERDVEREEVCSEV